MVENLRKEYGVNFSEYVDSLATVAVECIQNNSLPEINRVKQALNNFATQLNKIPSDVDVMNFYNEATELLITYIQVYRQVNYETN